MKTVRSVILRKGKTISIIAVVLMVFLNETYATGFADENSFRLGNKYLKEAKFNEALPIWLHIVENNPSNYSACFKLGLCYFHMEEKHANAIPYFKKTLDHTSKNYKFYSTKEKRAPGDVYYYLAETYLLLEMPDSALKYFVEYQEIFEGNTPVNVYSRITRCILTEPEPEPEMESEEPVIEEEELETSTIVDDIQMVNETELEESIELIDSYEIDYAIDVLEGVEVNKSAEIMANMEVEKAMDIFEDMELEKAIDIMEESPVEKSIGFIEDMEVEKAVTMMEEMEIEKAMDIAEGMEIEKMIELTDEMQIEKAVEITEGLGIGKTIEIIEGVEVEKASEIMSGLSQTKADEVVSVLKQKMEEGLSDNAVAIIKTYFSDQIDKKESIIFKRVYFDLNSSDLLMLTRKELLLLIDFLNENKRIKIEVVGHTDITGSWDHNLVLSNNRAREVYTFLLDREVSPQRIIHYGKGSAQPIASNETEEGRTQNRRVEVILLQ